MSTEQRPTGDWQNKAQREDANDLLRSPNQKPWYQQIFWIVVLLFLFWPVGLVLCWKSNWHLAVKIVITVLVALSIFMSWNMYQAVLIYQAAL